MKVLMISTDRNVFDEASAVRGRLLDQATLVDELHVIVFARKALGLRPVTLLDGKVTLTPTSSLLRPLYITDAILLAFARVKKSWKEWIVTTQDPFETAIVGFGLKLVTRIPLHVQLHTDPFSYHWRWSSVLNMLRSGFAIFLLRQADAVRVVSKRVERSVRSLGVDPARITEVPVFVDVSKSETSFVEEDIRAHYPQAKHIVLSVGRLEVEKDFGLLLSAFHEVREVLSDAMLLIVGSGSWHQALLSEVDRLNLRESVQIVPWSHDLIAYYRSADCYVQSSKYEGWGMAVIEAMSEGVPVVMTDVGCAGEVVVDGVSGMVVPVGDSNALAQAIIKVLTSPQLIDELVQGAKEKLAQLPNKQTTLSLYKKSWESARQTQMHMNS